MYNISRQDYLELYLLYLFSMHNGKKKKKKKKKNPKWTKDDLAKALEDVMEWCPKEKNSRTKYGIPWGTFCDKLPGRRKMEGHSKTLALGKQKMNCWQWLGTFQTKKEEK